MEPHWSEERVPPEETKDSLKEATTKHRRNDLGRRWRPTRWTHEEVEKAKNNGVTLHTELSELKADGSITFKDGSVSSYP